VSVDSFLKKMETFVTDGDLDFGLVKVRGDHAALKAPDSLDCIIDERSQVSPTEAFEIFAGKVFRATPPSCSSSYSPSGSLKTSRLQASASQSPTLMDPIARYYRICADLKALELDLDLLNSGNKISTAGVATEVTITDVKVANREADGEIFQCNGTGSAGGGSTIGHPVSGAKSDDASHSRPRPSEVEAISDHIGHPNEVLRQLRSEVCRISGRMLSLEPIIFLYLMTSRSSSFYDSSTFALAY
jgi:hypothetical protein